MSTPAAADRSRSRAGLARVMLVTYFVFVAFTVWLPAAVSGKVVGIVVFLARWIALRGIAPYEASLVTVEFLANVAFLIPVGAMLPLAWPQSRLWQVVLIGFLMSGLIESVQSLIPSRAPSVSDVAAKTLGILAGATVISAARMLRRTGDKDLAQSREPSRPR